MGRREQVVKAMKMQGPDYVPLFFMNKDKEESDVIMIEVEKHFMGPEKNHSEWGYKWDILDKKLTLGQPKTPVIKSWDDFDFKNMLVPDPYDKSRFSDAGPMMAQFGKDRYYIASFAITGFILMTFLRGFENVMEDFYFNREKIEKLANIVFGFEEELIKQVKDYGFDGISLWDDWGTQENLIISPALWREFFKPRYKRQIDLAHKHGLTVFNHCCGYVYDIIPDFIEIGVDMLNLGQPNINGIERIGKEFGGKICFVCPVSYQTTGISGTKEQIYTEVKEFVDNIGCYNGGLMGWIEDYSSMGMSEENFYSMVNAYREYGRYK